MDARVKLILTLAFVIFLSLTPSNAWPAYLLFLTTTLALALLSHLGIGFVLRRAFVAIPFALAALPLAFTGAAPFFSIPLFQEAQLTVSLPGLGRFASITLKSWISIQAAILLAATTRFSDILTALRQLGLPGILVSIIGLMWRYLLVISNEATRMLRARSSRSTSPRGAHPAGGTIPWRARVTGGMVGSVLLRSLERSDRVYAAMLSRGYSGDLPASEAATLSRKNQRVLILGVCFLAVLWVLSLFTGG